MDAPTFTVEGTEMLPRRHHPRRAWLGVLVTGSALAASLTACGSGSAPEFNEAASVLTKQQLKAALLSADQLGKGYVPVRAAKGDKEDTKDADLGCVTDTETAETPEPAAEVEATYRKAGKIPMPVVTINVSSFDTAADVSKNIEDFAAAFTKCKRIKFTTDNGAAVNLKLVTDNVPSHKEVDEQFNARAVGTITAGKATAPYGMWISVARAGNQGAAVMVMDVDLDSARLLNKFTTKTMERLETVARGGQPDGKPAKPKQTEKAKPNA